MYESVILPKENRVYGERIAIVTQSKIEKPIISALVIKYTSDIYFHSLLPDNYIDKIVYIKLIYISEKSI